jgi:large subunit ribosomal protein L19
MDKSQRQEKGPQVLMKPVTAVKNPYSSPCEFARGVILFCSLARMAGYFYVNLADGEHVMSDLLLQSFDKEDNENFPELHVGDNVTIHLRINVATRNERIQLVRGTIIRLRNSGNNLNFTVRRIAANGIGVERSFLVRSPRIEKIEVHRQAHVRRAQLYYMRGRTGKSARLREKRIY